MSATGSGRPKRQRPKQFSVSAKVSREEKARIEQRARAAGLSTSELIIASLSNVAPSGGDLDHVARELLSTCHAVRAAVGAGGLERDQIDGLIDVTRDLLEMVRGLVST